MDSSELSLRGGEEEKDGNQCLLLKDPRSCPFDQGFWTRKVAEGLALGCSQAFNPLSLMILICQRAAFNSCCLHVKQVMKLCRDREYAQLGEMIQSFNRVQVRHEGELFQRRPNGDLMAQERKNSFAQRSLKRKSVLSNDLGWVPEVEWGGQDGTLEYPRPQTGLCYVFIWGGHWKDVTPG